MIDRVRFGEHTCVVALGIDIAEVKPSLSLVEGSTENAALVTDLLVGLRDRGPMSLARAWPWSTGPALRRGVLEVFDHPAIARYQLHKVRNVEDRLPKKPRSVVAKRMRAAHHAETAS